MNRTLFEMRKNLVVWKDQLDSIKRELSLRRLREVATKAGFNPDQPRDGRGRWSDAIVQQFAASGNAAECDAQYKQDTFICNSVRTPLCWAQAAERYAACLSGRPVPQLRF